jgi:hypothetical protein
LIAPMRFSINIENLEPGEYECQVSVLNPTTGKSSFWLAPIKIIP